MCCVCVPRFVFVCVGLMCCSVVVCVCVRLRCNWLSLVVVAAIVVAVILCLFSLCVIARLFVRRSLFVGCLFESLVVCQFPCVYDCLHTFASFIVCVCVFLVSPC